MLGQPVADNAGSLTWQQWFPDSDPADLVTLPRAVGARFRAPTPIGAQPYLNRLSFRRTLLRRESSRFR
jgi:hypothetical protein